MKNTIKLFALFVALVGFLPTNAQKESDYYKITSVPIPEDVVLEVGGLAFNEKGQLAATTRRGEVWVIDNPESNNAKFTRYASGLHEPLGLAYKDGSYFLAQRGELTKLTDVNGDGRADNYETIYNWPLAANYHEYAYGPLILEDGNMLINLNLGWIGRGASLSKWSGWMLMVSPEGEMTPIATGMRSPAGLGRNAAGDIFYTENQGDWVGSGRMTHVEKGDFVGHPEGLKWSGEAGSPLTVSMEDITDDEETTLYEYAKTQPALKPPSVWFPHTLMGISTSAISVIPDNFGPFTGQLFVGDQGHSKIMRVFQEKVNGAYQGICFPFVEGFASGLLRLEWGPNNTLYAGQTNRGWASTGKSPYALQRLNWTGRTPFEMKAVRAKEDGFEIEFTQPVDRRTAANPDSYEISDFNYKYHHFYGSEAIRVEERTVSKVKVSQDGMKAHLSVEGMREGYIYEIKVPGVKNTQGQSLLHNFGYYTLNNIPGRDGAAMDHSHHTSAANADENVDLKSPKRITEMPGSWLDGPDQTVEIGTIAGMKFDTEEVTVKAGTKIKLELNNPDDMMHNLVITKPRSATEVGNLALELGLKGQSKGYVPDSDLVLAHTTLLRPNSGDVIYFIAPSELGDYEFVCTFPAHAATMRGILKVVK
ncbi:MAG: plastocyanin/azurin family copper-binding protein [Bacteroidota bacterium]